MRKQFGRFGQAVSLLMIVVLLLSTSAAFAGGGPNTIDGRTLEWKGQVNPRIHFEEISYSQGVIMATLDGEAVYLRVHNWDFLTIERTGVQCSNPVFDGDGFIGYDTDGRLSHWNAHMTPTTLTQMTFKSPVKPEARPDGLVNFGGDSQIVSQTPGPGNPNGFQTINIGNKKKLLSFASAPEGIYFTASEGSEKPMLYLAQWAGKGYKITDTGMQAEQVVYGAQRLYLIDKWGVTSWVNQGGKLVRDAIISATASPYVLAGGDGEHVYYLDGYTNVNAVGIPPDGKGIREIP